MGQTPKEEVLPTLKKQSTTYKLIVPEKVEEKIRYLIRKFPSTEWSGVLFYSHTGGFETGDLVINCEDIYPMDLGTSGFTEFSMAPEVSNYIANNMELFDCEMALVHSHHSMGAFFSGTDLSTLQKEGNDTNCFVSLVVDTRGTYVAAITRKVTSRREVTVVDKGSSYEFFGEGTHALSTGMNVTHEENKEEIQYFMLDVERHEVSNPLDFLDQRFEEIAAKKDLAKRTKEITPPAKEESSWDFFDRLKKANVEESYLFDKETMDNLKNDIEYEPDPTLIHAAVCKMITCSLIIDTSKCDLKQWITRHMNKVYDRIFPNEGQFDEWLGFIIPFTIDHFWDVSAPGNIKDEDYFNAVADAMTAELMPFANDQYPYIKRYITELQTIMY